MATEELNDVFAISPTHRSVYHSDMMTREIYCDADTQNFNDPVVIIMPWHAREQKFICAGCKQELRIFGAE